MYVYHSGLYKMSQLQYKKARATVDCLFLYRAVSVYVVMVTSFSQSASAPCTHTVYIYKFLHVIYIMVMGLYYDYVLLTHHALLMRALQASLYT